MWDGCLEKPKRLTIFAGHYGSGKTNLAVNFAHCLKAAGKSVTVADLDIVNPYFRTQDSAQELAASGISLICSRYAGSNLDVPAMPKEIYGLVADRREYGVLDVGGDDRGALALGRYVPDILEENDYAMLFVINKARPLTRNADTTLEVMGEIEAACRLPFTGIVNNTNVGPETTAETVLDSADYARRVSEKAGIPVVMTGVMQHLQDSVQGKVPGLFPMKIQKLYYHIDAEVNNGQTYF